MAICHRSRRANIALVIRRCLHPIRTDLIADPLALNRAACDCGLARIDQPFRRTQIPPRDRFQPVRTAIPPRRARLLSRSRNFE
jgi:hypothetical protein